MPKIDRYLTILDRYQATGVVLTSDGPVHLRLIGGDRATTQMVSHADLVAMVDEIAPPGGTAKLRAGSAVDLTYQLEGRTYAGQVVPEAGNRWTLTIELAIAKDAKPSGPPEIEAMLRDTLARGADDLHLSTGIAPKIRVAGRSEDLGGGYGALTAAAFYALVTPVMPSEAQAELRTRQQANFVFEIPDVASFQCHVFHEQRGPAAMFTGRRLGGAARLVPSAAVAEAAAASKARAEPPKPRFEVSPEANVPLIERLLRMALERGASDLHLSSNNPPRIRVHGEIEVLPGQAPITASAMMDLLANVMPAKNRKEFDERSDTDFAHAIPNVSRFRANVFRDRNGPGAAFRAIPMDILSPEQIGLPPAVLELCNLTKGLVVVTGPTGSGKSTTLATLVDVVNQQRSDHIITIEDPIEFVHHRKKCLINQREVHSHTRSFKDALRAALREDPDVVLLGEMRDLETVAIAIETAETGHLVFATLHTTTAPSTVDRIVDQFPADRQEQIRVMLSESLRGVVAQVLCKKIGGGRVAAYEVLIGSPAVSNLIREKKTFQLASTIQTGKKQGMQTLNDSLVELAKKKLIEPREAYRRAVDKTEIASMLQAAGMPVTPETPPAAAAAPPS